MHEARKFVFDNKIIDSPNDLREIQRDQLQHLALALRGFVESVPVDKPAHRNSSLGVAELTVALHYWLNTPDDLLVFDVGHQSYAHKVLTNRAGEMHRLRQIDGPSGFLLPSESPYDVFVTGHSSTSLSAMAGAAYADRILKGSDTRRHAVVIGDGALTAGVAMEALNFIGEQNVPMIIVLNDNAYSIDVTRGALHEFQSYRQLAAAFGIEYYGPIQGHSVEEILCALENLPSNKPVLVHCKTQTPPVSSIPVLAPKSFASAIERCLRSKMEVDERVVLISPAMLSGAGWRALERDFPKRVIDVGIAEQHAVAFCAGLIKADKLPVCHIYSSFFQRAVDQFIHDIAIAQLPVIFLIDRAGLVGEDGPTHHGVFDWPVLLSVPETKVIAPTTPERAAAFLSQNIGQNECPIVIRYPRDGNVDCFHFERKTGSDSALVYFGALGQWVCDTDLALNTDWDVVPIESIDEDWAQLNAYKRLVFFQDCAEFGGPASRVLQKLSQQIQILPQYLVIGLPQEFVPHGNLADLHRSFGLDPETVALRISKWMQRG